MKIKHCPHCGGTACLNSNYSYKTRSYFIFVKCDVCGATGKTYVDEENPTEYNWEMPACQDAICAWNLRYDDTHD